MVLSIEKEYAKGEEHFSSKTLSHNFSLYEFHQLVNILPKIKTTPEYTLKIKFITYRILIYPCLSDVKNSMSAKKAY